ncbi:hypothetical protein GFGA_1d0988 [Gluconobacter frateurii NBRC 103465]|nr:hypothetical protein GFGA_1d0988 [Gluconobacter frateurii NBRC 103465]
MNSEAETLLRTQTEKRRLLRWRIAAILFFLTALIVAVGKGHPVAADPGGRPHIARVVIRGVIGNDVSRITTALKKSPEFFFRDWTSRCRGQPGWRCDGW